jgi:phasin
MSSGKSLGPAPKMQMPDLPKFAMSQVGTPEFAMPKFDRPKVEMPGAFREFAERGVAQARDTYEKMKAAAEAATDVLETTYSAAAKGYSDYGLKMIEVASANTNAAFHFAGEVVAAKTLSEVVELTSAHARKQLEELSEQSRELAALAQKVANETAEPLGGNAISVRIDFGPSQDSQGSGRNSDVEFEPNAGRGTISVERGASLFLRRGMLRAFAKTS